MPEASAFPLLWLRDIAKSFGDKVALSHVDLDIEAARSM